MEKLGPCVSVCLNGERRPAWKTSWIFHVGGSRRQYKSGDRTWVISNGPRRLGESFRHGYCKRRLVVSSQTLFPIFQGVNVLKLRSLMIRRAVSWVAKASFLASRRESNLFSSEGRNVFPSGGYARGSYPSISLNGDVLVEWCGAELCWNLAVGRRSSQLLGLLAQKMRRYVSISWLVCSVCTSVWG